MENTNWDGTIKILLERGKNLKIADYLSSDPYCKIVLEEKNIISIFQTKVIYSNLNPLWNEEFNLPIKREHGNPIKILFAIWDFDRLSEDDFLGQCETSITPTSELLGHSQVQSLQPRNTKEFVKGSITFTISYLPKEYQGHNKWQYHSHKVTGLARSITSGEATRMYGTYNVVMHHVQDIFGNSWQHWNTKYEAAKTIFQNAVISGTIVTQHKHLYSDVSTIKNGYIRSGDDLLLILKNGIHGGKPRFYTYVLNDNAWFFSETGAAFFTDFTSKHAMHACVSEYVRYAGEFHFQPNQSGKYRLVIDNNSGTYSPNKELLPCVKTIFEINFPGLEVEVLDYADPKLKEYKEKVLSASGNKK